MTKTFTAETVDQGIEDFDPVHFSEEVDRKDSEFHQYSASSDLTTPVVVRGTNVAIRHHPALTVKKPSMVKTQRLADRLQLLEEGMECITIGMSDIADMEVTKGMLKLSINHGPDLHMPNPQESPSLSATRGLCKALGIPWGFARKNPDSINQDIVSFWQNRKATEDNPPVHILFKSQADAGNLQECLGIVKGKRERGGRPIPIDTPSQLWPTPGTILNNLIEGSKKAGNGLSLGIQTFKNGYNSTNHGRFMTRMLLMKDDEPVSVKIPRGVTDLEKREETYHLGLSMESPFHDPNGQVSWAIQLFRLICLNGATVSVPAEEVQGFLNENPQAVRKSGFWKTTTHFASSTDMITQATNITNTLYSLSSRLDISGAYQTLDQKDPDMVASAILEQAEENRLISMNLAKWVAIEAAGNPKITNVMDLVDIITLMARGFQSAIQIDAENKAMQWASAVALSVQLGNVKKHRMLQGLERYKH